MKTSTRAGQFVRPTSLGAALYAAANRPGTNHPVGFVVKRNIQRDERAYSILERSSSPKRPASDASSLKTHELTFGDLRKLMQILA